MSAGPIEPGWFRVRCRQGVAVLWVQPFDCPAPNPWVIAGTTREAARSVATCAFLMRTDEFEHEIVERIAMQPEPAEGERHG